MAAHLPVLIPVVFFLAAALIPIFGRARPAVAYGLAFAATLAATAFSVAGLLRVSMDGPLRYHLGGWPPPIGIELVMDSLSAFMVTVLNAVAWIVLVHSRRTVEAELPGRTMAFWSVAMLMLGGFSGIVLTGDLFNLYVFLEISSLASYALLAVGDRRAAVAAFRYLILGTIGASFYLLGVAFLLMTTGSLNMTDVAGILNTMAYSEAPFVGILLIVMGLGLKMALFPMHTWLPDSYTYASSAATALIAPIGTKVAAYALFRVFFYVVGIDSVHLPIPLMGVVGLLGVLGMIAGSVMAIAQTDFKRMLAYSSVGQVGYIALGIGLGSPLGLIGGLLHVMNHAVMKAGLFLVSGNLFHRLGHTDIRRLDDSLRSAMPWTTGALAIGALSMIGLPPTAGFFSKWYLVRASLEASNWLFLAAILISSLLNAVYFFRVLERIYIREAAPGDKAMAAAEGDAAARAPAREVGPSMLGPTLLLGVAVVVLGLGNLLVVEKVFLPMIDGINF